MSIEIPDAKGVEVVDADGNSEEFLQVQNGPSLNRDGGPYGDQTDAIRDEKYNAAREGREPDFEALVPSQYRAVSKEDLRKTTFPDVGSLTRKIDSEETAVAIPTVDYSKGEQLSSDYQAEIVQPSEPGEPVNSEEVAKRNSDFVDNL